MEDTNAPQIPAELKDELKDLWRRLWDLAHVQLVDLLRGLGDLREEHLCYYYDQLENFVSQFEFLGLELIEIVDGRDPSMPSFRQPKPATGAPEKP